MRFYFFCENEKNFRNDTSLKTSRWAFKHISEISKKWNFNVRLDQNALDFKCQKTNFSKIEFFMKNWLDFFIDFLGPVFVAKR